MIPVGLQLLVTHEKDASAVFSAEVSRFLRPAQFPFRPIVSSLHGSIVAAERKMEGKKS